MMYRLNGSWIVVWRMARPTSVFVSLSWANIRNIGVSSAWYGTIRARSRKTKRSSLPGIGNRAERIAGRDRQREREGDRQERRPEAVAAGSVGRPAW